MYGFRTGVVRFSDICLDLLTPSIARSSPVAGKARGPKALCTLRIRSRENGSACQSPIGLAHLRTVLQTRAPKHRPLYELGQPSRRESFRAMHTALRRGQSRLGNEYFRGKS